VLKSKENLKLIRNSKCTVCKVVPCDPHHVKTRGSGGGDELSNLMPLCREHHIEIHKIGNSKMCEKYPSVYAWLIRNERFDIIYKFAPI
jgi:5-methylcytosine-specific restriction endonuclease McrA